MNNPLLCGVLATDKHLPFYVRTVPLKKNQFGMFMVMAKAIGLHIA
jgi:hypothetical protein